MFEELHLVKEILDPWSKDIILSPHLLLIAWQCYCHGGIALFFKMQECGFHFAVQSQEHDPGKAEVSQGVQCTEITVIKQVSILCIESSELLCPSPA